MKVYDLRRIASACGDYTLYVLAEIDKLRPGERLKIIAARNASSVLDEVAETLEKAAPVRVVERGYEEDTYYIVVERR